MPKVNQIFRIKLWITNSHCLHTSLTQSGHSPYTTQVQNTFHECSGASLEAFTNQKNRCSKHSWHVPGSASSGSLSHINLNKFHPSTPDKPCARRGTKQQWDPFIHILTIHEEPVASEDPDKDKHHRQRKREQLSSSETATAAKGNPRTTHKHQLQDFMFPFKEQKMDTVGTWLNCWWKMPRTTEGKFLCHK